MFMSILRGRDVLVVDEDIDTLDIGFWVRGGKLDLIIHILPGVFIGGDYFDDNNVRYMPDYKVNSQAVKPVAKGAIWSSVPIRPENSNVRIINAGTLFGCNAWGGYCDVYASMNSVNRGGPAIDLNCPVVIENSGLIYGGGGSGTPLIVHYPRLPGYMTCFASGGYPRGNYFWDGTVRTMFYEGLTEKRHELALGAYGVVYPEYYPTRIYHSGDCAGPGLIGTEPWYGNSGDTYPGLGVLTSIPDVYVVGLPGPIGYSVNAEGNSVTVISGASDMRGDIV